MSLPSYGATISAVKGLTDSTTFPTSKNRVNGKYI